MRKFISVIAVLVGFLSTVQMCRSKENVSSAMINSSCFTEESLKNITWQNHKLDFFQQHYEESIEITVRYYDNDYFLVVENKNSSSFEDILTIFDCSGNLIDIGGVDDHIRFHDHSKKVEYY
ncbi:hypothetical protein [Fibrivirga algicola]|uniref:Uncharacterized protein n=1 Tax=Fibrivirga algicola TaxID=2950420 RepID=A0ABX0QB64_9BACT|nr:hypothetical protein [Fibrivirga algicola]NID09545.1 hypothetical protein [Fibrivirga algicola]